MPSKRMPGRSGRAERGFTLVEMVVATAVLAIGVAGAVATFGVIARASGTAAEYELAALLAERRMAEIEAEGIAAAVSDTGDFGEEHPECRWEQEVLDTETQGVLELRLTVEWDSGQSERRVVVSTYLLDETLRPGDEASEAGVL
ncbi:MAG: prepilin-type N-terminal cleavage/methylation domain-containing protein [Armatimonadetes bacterium]|nr:prepilin-type N-terminal cleavage/methylation domain-containing protein [Armatimonadota bacterium]